MFPLLVVTWATVVGVALAEALATDDDAPTGPTPVNDDANIGEDNAVILAEATEGRGTSEDTTRGEDVLEDAADDSGALEDDTLLATGADEATTKEAATDEAATGADEAATEEAAAEEAATDDARTGT